MLLILQAVEELFKMMRLMVMNYPDSKEEELKAVSNFRRQTIQLYLSSLDARTSWQTLITYVHFQTYILVVISRSQ